MLMRSLRHRERSENSMEDQAGEQRRQDSTPGILAPELTPLIYYSPG